MHFITYFNVTDAYLDGTYNMLIIFTYIELAAIFINCPSYILFIYLTMNTTQYHWNMRLILTFIGVEYVFQMIFRLAQIYLILRGLDSSTSEYTMTSYGRCIFFLISGSILPCIIIERLCATYFLDDYEQKKRPIIPLSIATGSITFGALAAKSFHNAASNIPFLVLGLLMNTWAVMTNLWLEKLNYRRYTETMDSVGGKREYSLVQRFQIAENIKTCKLFHHVVLSISFFTLICILLMAIENFGLSSSSRNLNSVILNYCIIMYSMIVPCVMVYHNELWRKEIKRIYQKIWRRPHVVEPGNSQQSKLGSELTWDSRRQTEQYFHQLNKIWS